jgi:hypothetical protein
MLAHDRGIADGVEDAVVDGHGVCSKGDYGRIGSISRLGGANK